MAIRMFEKRDLDAFEGRISKSLWSRIDAQRTLFDENDEESPWLTLLRNWSEPVAMYRVHSDHGAQAIVARDIGARELRVLRRMGTALIRRARKPVYAVVKCADDNTEAALKFARWMGFTVGEIHEGHYICEWKGCRS